MIGPFARILARYVSGALVAYGAFSGEDVAVIEADLAIIIGTVIGAGSEMFYAFAVKRGWSK